MSKLIIIGAGPAGLIAAGTAAAKGHRVTLYDKNPRPARKLMITGKGRCNVTNDSEIQELIAAVPQNGRFLYSAFSAFGPQDIIALLESRGVPLKTERGRRVFPESDKAVDVVDALVKYARGSGAEIKCGKISEITLENNTACGVKLKDGEFEPADAVIIATGGISYPGTGSDGDGYKFAAAAGHNIIPPTPSLVPLEAHEGFCGVLTGLSLKNISLCVRDADSGKIIYTDFGEMMFTHFGVTGPVILSASAHLRDLRPEKYILEIDLKPGLTPEQLDARIIRDFEKYQNKDFGNSLFELLPKKLASVIIRLSGISPETKTNQITKLQRQGLASLIKCLKITVTGFRHIDEAVITRGGVDTREINPKTLESKLVSGLYFAGEVIDVDAYTGGFNLQIAYSTGFLAGSSI